MVSTRARRIVVAIATLALVAVPTVAAGAQTDDHAPVDQPGPTLEAPVAELDAAYSCPDDVAAAEHDPVLLVPGTTLTTERNYAWNWIPALEAEGIPVCTVELHERGMADLQRSVENVVHAVLSIHRSTGRPVRMIGYSQGGLQLRFALRFWPEVRDAVSEIVQLAAVNNGSAVPDVMCLTGCAAAVWQMRTTAALVEAINSRALVFEGIEYTSLYSRLDEVATPNLNGESSHLDGATNIAFQDVCPLNVADHITTGTTDPVAYALALDALTNPGPADPDRLAGDVCTQLFMPGVDPLDAPLRLVALTEEVVTALAGAPHVSEEPALRCYITASCVAPAPEPTPEAGPRPASEVGVQPVAGRPGLPATGGSEHLVLGPLFLLAAAVVEGYRRRASRLR